MVLIRVHKSFYATKIINDDVNQQIRFTGTTSKSMSLKKGQFYFPVKIMFCNLKPLAKMSEGRGRT